MIHETSAPDSLPVATHRAIKRTLAGTKSDADSAGRMVMTIPADTAPAILLEVEAALKGADPRFWISLEGARDSLCRDGLGKARHRPPTVSDTVPALCVKALGSTR